MTNDLVGVFSEKDNQVLFTGKYMEVYIPYYYIDSKMLRINAKSITSLGIFLFRVFKNEDKKDHAKMHVYKLPCRIDMKPTNYHKDKISVNGTVYEMLVLQFYTNDVFIDSTVIVQDDDLVNDYITFYHNGKIPNFIKYDDVVMSELNCILINKMKYPVPMTLFEAICSEINRDINDISKSCRKSMANGAGERDYKPVSISQIPSFNSTFTSITFEDIDYQLTSSVNRTRYNKEDIISPIEKTIKY